jgi:hypothetical protein
VRKFESAAIIDQACENTNQYALTPLYLAYATVTQVTQ